MAFADLKNDYIFRRIVGTHPDILRRLLNDLLERTDAQTIEQIEYLPGEQLPVVEGAKLSILDVRCKDRAGTMFVVEMQLIHHPADTLDIWIGKVFGAKTAAEVLTCSGGLASYEDLPDLLAQSSVTGERC